MILIMHMHLRKFALTEIIKKDDSIYYYVKFEHYETEDQLKDIQPMYKFIDYDLPLLFKSLHHFASMYNKEIKKVYIHLQETDTLYDISLTNSLLFNFYKRITNYNINSIGEII